MMLKIRFWVHGLFLDYRMIVYNLIWPLLLSGSAAVAILLGVNYRTAELKDAYPIGQAAIGLSASWISVYCQQNVLERSGKKLMLSLPGGKMYVGPYRSLRSSLLYAVLFAALCCVMPSRLTDAEQSLVLCGTMIFQALFFAGLGLLCVGIVKTVISPCFSQSLMPFCFYLPVPRSRTR